MIEKNIIIVSNSVETIEEDKEIEELQDYADCDDKTGLACNYTFQEKVLKDKINEVIRKVNKMDKEGK